MYIYFTSLGNRFGSDGIKDIRLAVKGFNLSHSVLDSLSDDEGDASDDEDDDEGVDTEDGQSSGVEDVSVREETGGTVSVDPALLVRGVAIGTPLANGRTQLEDEVSLYNTTGIFSSGLFFQYHGVQDIPV